MSATRLSAYLRKGDSLPNVGTTQSDISVEFSFWELSGQKHVF